MDIRFRGFRASRVYVLARRRHTVPRRGGLHSLRAGRKRLGARQGRLCPHSRGRGRAHNRHLARQQHGAAHPEDKARNDHRQGLRRGAQDKGSSRRKIPRTPARRARDNVTTAVQSFAELSSTLKEAAASIKDILGENRENIKQGIENLKTASLKLDAAMTTLNQLSQDLSPELKETVASIKNVARKIDKGEGPIGKLINDDATHEKLNKTLSGINSYIER